MKFTQSTKYLISVLISSIGFFSTDSAYSQSQTETSQISSGIFPQIVCTISPKKIIYIDGSESVQIDGVEDQLYFYYAAGDKPLGQVNTKVNTKGSPLFSYLFHEIEMIEIKNSNLLAIPNIDNRKIYHFVTVRLKNGKTLNSYLKVKPGKGYYYPSNGNSLKTFNLADCKKIKFEGIEAPS